VLNYPKDKKGDILTVNNKLTQNEFIMLRSLLDGKYYGEYDSPYWKVGRYWEYNSEYISDAIDACELLLERKFVKFKYKTCCPEHGGLKIYELTEKGMNFIKKANGEEEHEEKELIGSYKNDLFNIGPNYKNKRSKLKVLLNSELVNKFLNIVFNK